MTCIHIPGGILCVGAPSEAVTMANGKTLRMEWGSYFGPAVETRSGLRSLTNAEFRDPNVDAWIVAHGGKSCRENELTKEDMASAVFIKRGRGPIETVKSNGDETPGSEET